MNVAIFNFSQARMNFGLESPVLMSSCKLGSVPCSKDIERAGSMPIHYCKFVKTRKVEQ